VWPQVSAGPAASSLFEKTAAVDDAPMMAASFQMGGGALPETVRVFTPFSSPEHPFEEKRERFGSKFARKWWLAHPKQLPDEPSVTLENPKKETRRQKMG
jgi:hypothetical protein